MKKLALILAAVAGLTMTAHNSQAGPGWTLDQSMQRYGDPTSGPAHDHYGRTFYRFHADGYAITAFMAPWQEVENSRTPEKSRAWGARSNRWLDTPFPCSQCMKERETSENVETRMVAGTRFFGHAVQYGQMRSHLRSGGVNNFFRPRRAVTSDGALTNNFSTRPIAT